MGGQADFNEGHGETLSGETLVRVDHPSCTASAILESCIIVDNTKQFLTSILPFFDSPCSWVL